MNERIKNRMKGIVVAVAAAAMALTPISGCSKRGDQTEGDKRYIIIKGSDTMVHLVGNWAEAFMQQNPGIEVLATGGGSETGIAALLNGTTDICAASRRMNDKELMVVIQKNIRRHEIEVAKDGIAVIVNAANPVSELTIEQLGEIFTGASPRWSDVGGPDEQIVVTSREPSSGTYVLFQEMVLKKHDYMQDAKLLPATSTIIQSVSTVKWAIGYVGLGYALAAGDEVKIVAVKANDKSLAIAPSDKTVRSGEYPIARPLYFYLNGEPKGKVKEFVDFCLSAEGQTIVTDTGYVAIR